MNVNLNLKFLLPLCFALSLAHIGTAQLAQVPNNVSNGKACTSGGIIDTNNFFGDGSILVHEIGHCQGLFHTWAPDDVSIGAAIGTAVTDADGNYSLMGLFPCGSYSVELTASVPDCYVNSSGVVGPVDFNVDGDGNADGFDFN